MTSDSATRIEARVRKHAALADPARLRIVDLLATGDMSPTELRAAVGLESNLLAHHLKTLERAGLISRRRSEGDGRRTYVRLIPGALELGQVSTTQVERVLFVCTANSARSQLAEAIWNEASHVPATSAGTHPADSVAPRAVTAAARHGLSLAGANPRLLSDVPDPGTFVVTVCDRAHEEYTATVTHWSIADPVRVDTDAAFEKAFAEIRERVSALAPRLRVAS